MLKTLEDLEKEKIYYLNINFDALVLVDNINLDNSVFVDKYSILI